MRNIQAVFGPKLFNLCLAFLLFVSSSVAFGESGDAGESGAGAEGRPALRVLDRFGAVLSAEEIRFRTTKAAFAEDCGLFRLHFEDAGSGFDDPALGAARRDLACRVFRDLGALLIAPQGPRPLVDLQVRPSTVGMPPTALGVASSYYLIPAGVDDGLVDGEVWKTIHGGVDSYEAFRQAGIGPLPGHHGYVQVNFDHPFHLGAGTLPAAQDFDLYSVLLHEAFHALGFGSLVVEGGRSWFSGATDGLFSRFDSFLRDAQGQPLVTVADGCYESRSTQAAGLLTGGCGSLVFAGIHGYLAQPQPIHAPATFARGTSLSHFDPTCPGAPSDYVMGPTSSPGPAAVRRVPALQEVQTLCELGYRTSGTYGTVPSSPYAFKTYPPCGRPLAGVDDLESSVEAGSTTPPIDVLPNDQQADRFRCLEPVLGGGSTSVTAGTSFTYTADGSFSGTAVLRYLPEDGSQRTGNMTYVLVPVTAQPIPPCPPDACNLVCHGDLEVFADRYLFPLSDFVVTNSNSPDRLTSDTGTWGFGCPLNSSLPGPHSGNVFAGLAGFSSNQEGLKFELDPPMQSGDYRISVWAHSLQPTCQAELNLFVNEDPPCAVPTKLQDCSSWNPDLVLQQQVATAQWIQYGANYSALNPMKSLVIYPSGTGTSVVVDDIQVVKVGEPPLTVTSTVHPEAVCPGDTVIIKTRVCRRPGDVVTAPVELRNILPAGLTPVAGDFYPNLEAKIPASAFADEACVELELVTRLESEPPSWPLRNRVELSSGGCAAQGSSAVVEIEPARDYLRLEKTVSHDRPAPGERLTYTVEICNDGPVPIEDVAVRDRLPTGLLAPSSADFTLAGNVLSVSGLRLPAASVGTPACVALSFEATVDPGAEGTIRNCASLVDSPFVCGAAEESCVDVEVPVYRCPDGTPRATVGGLHYPGFTCEEAVARARSATGSYHYRRACQGQLGGALPDEVRAARVLHCTESSSGAMIEAEVCCAGCPEGTTGVKVEEYWYPLEDCAALAVFAEDPLYFPQLGYGNQCADRLGGPSQATSARVADCRPSPIGGLSWDVELCCTTPPTCPEGSERRSFNNILPSFLTCDWLSDLVDGISVPYVVEDICRPGPAEVQAIFLTDCEPGTGSYSYDLCCADPPPPPCPAGSERISLDRQSLPWPIPCRSLESALGDLVPFQAEDLCRLGPAIVVDAQLRTCDERSNGVDYEIDLCCSESGPPDLEITKTPSGPFYFGEVSTYTLQVQNVAGPPQGGPTAGPIVVTDTLPEYMKPIPDAGSFAVPGWTCEVEGQTVTCTYDGPPLLPGETAPPIHLQVRPEARRGFLPVENCARVKAVGDASSANDESCHLTPIQFLPNLSLNKERVAREQYLLTISNRIIDSTTGEIRIIETLPPGQLFNGFEGDGWTCTPAPPKPGGQDVSCHHPGPLEGNSSLSLKIFVTGDLDPKKINCARVETDGERDLADNTSCACPDPADPDVHYQSHDPGRCRWTACGFRQTSFSNRCGCGCIDTGVPPWEPVLNPHFDAGWSWFSGSGRSVEGEGDVTAVTETELEAGLTAGVSVEWRPRLRWGLEAGLLYAAADLEIRRQLQVSGAPQGSPEAGGGSVDIFGLTLSPLFHVRPTGKLDLFAGPMLSRTLFQESAGFRDFPLDDDLALGAQIGFRLPISERWSLGSRLRFLRVETRAGSVPMEIDWNAATLSLQGHF